MSLIEGNVFVDERGIVRFVNDFEMTSVVRMYCIEPKLGLVRAWQGHKQETKWFYATKGSFKVQTINMETHKRMTHHLLATESKVLEIPGGNYNGFESLEEGSVLMVFSDFNLKASQQDDYRESLEKIKW